MTMILSVHEAVVWWEYHHGKTTSDIASDYESGQPAPPYVYKLFESSNRESERQGIQLVQLKDTQYVSRVLNRAKGKVGKVLREHAKSHRLDVESVLDEKGILIGFDYQANTQVYIVFSLQDGVIVWYRHDSYAGKLCPDCPKRDECRNTLDVIIEEYDIELRPDEEELYMTEQSIAIFNKVAAMPSPKYRRSEGSG
jgi:hypothetical protein